MTKQPDMLIRRAAIILALIAVFLYFPSIGGDQDVFYHLRYGEHFVTHLTTTIDHSQFTWTPYDFPHKYVTWIGSSILYITYSLFAQYGLYLLDYAILGLILLLFISYRRDIGTFEVLAMFAAILVLNLKYLYIKPDMFSGLFFAATLFLYYRVKEGSPRRLLLLYFPLFAVWVNTHGGFIIGLLTIVCLSLLEHRRHFLIGAVLAVAGSCLNPYGPKYILDTIQGFLGPDMLATKSTIMEYMSVWGVLLFQPAGTRMQIAVFAMAAMALSYIILILTKPSLFDLPSILLLAFFYVLGMAIIRATMYFPIVWLFVFFHAYRGWDKKRAIRILQPVAFAIILLLFLRITILVATEYDSLSWIGMNWKDNYPIEEAEYVKKLHSKEKLWNDYLSGGYLIWGLYPEHKLFIDPRYGGQMVKYGPTPSEIVSPDGVKHYQSRFPFKIALVAYHETTMIQWFLAADWRIAFIGKNALVLVDKSIIPSIPQEARNQDLSPGRFADLSSPGILKTLFGFYVIIGPKFGQDIEGIYARNVRITYQGRKADLAWMKSILDKYPRGKS